MAKITKEHIILVLIFILVLATRLALVFPQKSFDYEAYGTLRQAEHIRDTGLPLYNDPLSYSGRTLVFPPLFEYLLAGFSFLMPLEMAAKIIPNLLFASLTLIIYLIAKQMTKNKASALLAAFFSGFVPIIYSSTNQASPYSLGLPLIFLLSYAFLKIDEKGFATWNIILAILLLLAHPSFFMLLISFLVYFLLIRITNQELSKREVEITLFTFFLALWFNLLLFKRAFFMHGIRFIWQNIPSPLLSTYFTDVSFLGIIYAVGVVPLLLGVYAIYHVLFKIKSRAATLYLSFALVSFAMLWLKLIPFTAGLLFLSINMILLSAHSTKLILVGISKSKKPGLANLFVIVAIALFVLTAITPLIITANAESKNSPPKEDMAALQWMKNNIPSNSVVLGSIEEGFLINQVAHQKNIADQNFLLINNIDQRYYDIEHIFTFRLKAEAIRLINYYDIDYIFLSTKAMEKYNITELFYADPECFELAYDSQAKVYKFLGCKVE